MTRWLAPGAINIIWTKKIYNGLHVRCVEKVCVLRQRTILSCSLTHPLSLLLPFFRPYFHSLSLSFSRSLIHSHIYTPYTHTCTHTDAHTVSLSHFFSFFQTPTSHMRAWLARTYSINREPRYCTASPHSSALVASTFVCVSSHLRFAAVVTLSEAALVRPREQTHRFFFVVISINKEIPIQGRTLAYPMR